MPMPHLTWDSVKAAERANEEDRVHTEGILIASRTVAGACAGKKLSACGKKMGLTGLRSRHLAEGCRRARI